MNRLLAEEVSRHLMTREALRAAKTLLSPTRPPDWITQEGAVEAWTAQVDAWRCLPVVQALGEELARGRGEG